MSIDSVSFTEAMLEANEYLLESLPEVLVIGLGVSYPGGADGTMGVLGSRFPERVIDTPVSEAVLTGAAVGSAIAGMRPIVHHGRVEFALFAADQIVTQAAKWRYMFDGAFRVPITFRIGVGRQWGNGPQHTQSIYSLFAGTPGLRVVVPSSPRAAKDLLIASALSDDPVAFMEPRWLYKTRGYLAPSNNSFAIDRARVIREGSDLTVVTYGDGVMEALRASRLWKEAGLSVEILDLVTLNPFDWDAVASSIAKTGRLVTFESVPRPYSVCSQVVAFTAVEVSEHLREMPRMVNAASVPVPTAPSLTAAYYPTWVDLHDAVATHLGEPKAAVHLDFEELHLLSDFEFPPGL